MDGTVQPVRGPEVRLKAIILPTEHGSWGFLLEPLVASLAVAWSTAGLAVALTAVSAFLARQPLKVYLGDVAAGRNLPQTSGARRYAALFVSASAVFFAAAVAGGGIDVMAPFAAVAPLVAVQIYFDAKRRSRALIAEIVGAVAASSSAAAVGLAGGIEPASAVALWGLFAARLMTSVLYVRNRLLAEKGKAFSRAAPVAAHIAALAGAALLASRGLTSWSAAAVFCVLLGRSAVGLSVLRRPTKAMKIGVWEVVYGVMLVAAVVAGEASGF